MMQEEGRKLIKMEHTPLKVLLNLKTNSATLPRAGEGKISFPSSPNPKLYVTLKVLSAATLKITIF
jgi:hypothetical protein